MLKIYNTLSRKKDVLRPRIGRKINLFVCGPTVYDSPHMGHARTYIFFDFFAKFLRAHGYNVFYLQNITDIDDKIIKRAEELGMSPKRLASRFEKEYLEDMKALGVDGVSKYARATEYIKEIQNQIKILIQRRFAYQIEDGVYYDISKFKDYGKLSGRTVDQAEDAISRIDESVGKKNKGDFCLWKISDADEPSWPSPWGKGRPGWHIEDTAITEKYFGPQYDAHGGARDLIFPHHEAEIAQMEAASAKKPLVKYWVHTGFLTVGGEKMAKSLGNFITARDFLKKYPARMLRLLALKAHYRSPIDYDETLLAQMSKELERIDKFIERLESAAGKTKSAKNQLMKTKKDFLAALNDDLNTPQALAAIFELISEDNTLMDKNQLSGVDAKNILKFLGEIDAYFGFIFAAKTDAQISKKILGLVAAREKYRKAKNWIRSDKIRTEIVKLGYQIEDTKSAPKIKKLNTK